MNETSSWIPEIPLISRYMESYSGLGLSESMQKLSTDFLYWLTPVKEMLVWFFQTYPLLGALAL